MGKLEKKKLQQSYLYVGQPKNILQPKFLPFHNIARQKPEEQILIDTNMNVWGICVDVCRLNPYAEQNRWYFM